jgi:hypothetical protein
MAHIAVADAWPKIIPVAEYRADTTHREKILRSIHGLTPKGPLVADAVTVIPRKARHASILNDAFTLKKSPKR